MLESVFAIAVAAAAAASASSPSAAYTHEAVTTLRGLLQPDDYPPESLDRYEEGKVAIRISIDASGAISDCVIEKSSSFPSLDSQTCRLVWKRAHFRAPAGAQEQRAAEAVRTEIVWRIEQDPSPSEPWSVRTGLTFADGGELRARLFGRDLN